MGRDTRSRSRSRSPRRDGGRKYDHKLEKKLNETREEKMLRRLEKKKRKREAEEDRKTICGYTDENNRFGDSNLTSSFQWHKKEKAQEASGGGGGGRDDRKKGLSERELRQQEAERKRKIEEEVEKVKRRREEREKEQAWMEEEKARMARESEEQQHNEWEAKADEFHLQQAQLRAKIRTTEGRAKPIDILAKNLMDDMEVEMTEPYKLFKNLSLQALEELQGDIQQHKNLDHKNEEFWDAMTIVCEDELALARAREERGRSADASSLAIAEDVSETFVGKSWKELKDQEQEIREGIDNDMLDPEFAETVLVQLKTALAKAKLREIHGEILRKRLASLEGDLAKESMAYEASNVLAKEEGGEEGSKAEKESEWDEAPQGKDASDDSDDENAGSFSPVLEKDYAGDDAVDADADKLAIEAQRKSILESEKDKLKSAASKSANSELDNSLYQQEARKGMNEDEAAFSADMEVRVLHTQHTAHTIYAHIPPTSLLLVLLLKCHRLVCIWKGKIHGARESQS